MKTYVIDSAMRRSVSNRLRYKEARRTKSADLVEGMKKRQKRGEKSLERLAFMGQHIATM